MAVTEVDAALAQSTVAPRTAAPAAPVSAAAVTQIDFKRGEAGAGKLIVSFSGEGAHASAIAIPVLPCTFPPACKSSRRKHGPAGCSSRNFKKL